MRTSLTRGLLWPLAYLTLTIALCAPYSLTIDTRLPDDGDALLGLWIVWAGATHLSAGYPGLLDVNAYYPHPHGLIYTEPMLAQAVVMAGLLKLLGNAVLAVNLIGLLSLALGAWGAHLLLRELVGDERAAFLGALTYAFCARSFYELARIQLLSLGWIPLALFFLHRLAARPRGGHALGLTLTSLVNGLACFYYVVFHGFVMAFVLPAYIVTHRLWRTRRTLVWLAVSGAALGLGLLFLAWPFLSLYAHYGFVGKAESLDLLEYVRPVPGSWPAILLGIQAGRAASFLGLAAPVLSVIGLVTLVRRTSSPPSEGQGGTAPRLILAAYAAMAACALLLSFGPDLLYDGARLGPGPYALVRGLPLFGMLRTAPRLYVLTRLGMAVLVAVAATALLARLRQRPWRARLAVAAAAALLVSEQWSPRLTQGAQVPLGRDLPEVYGALAASPSRGPLAELPVYPFHLVRFNAAEAAFSTAHGRPILFSKPSFAPPALEFLRQRLERFPEPSSVTLLRALGVETIVVHPARWPAAYGVPAGPRLEQLDQQGAREGLRLVRTFAPRDDLLSARFHVGGERLYRLEPLAAEGRPRACACREIERSSIRSEATPPTRPRLMFDGDRRTAWTTVRQQIEDDVVVLAFDRPRRLARLELEMTFPYDEFARHLELQARRDGQWGPLPVIEDVWADLALIRQLVRDPASARLRYDFAGDPVDRLALRITARDLAGSPWSIPELHAFELLE